MTTSITIDEETKARLERLQAEISRQTGGHVSEREVLAELLEAALDSPDEIIDAFRSDRVPLSDDERSAFHEGRISSGESTDEEMIDDTLYD